MIPYFSFSAVKLGPFTLYIWGMLAALAVIVVFTLVVSRVKKAVEREFLFDLLIWILVGIIIGAKVGYLIQFPNYFFNHPLEFFNYTQGGLTSYGGFFGALLAAFLYFKFHSVKKKTVLFLLDLAAQFLPLGLAIGRLGCFLIKDHPGRTTTLPWGIVWPDGTVRHPVALYLFLNCLIIFFLLWFIKPKLKPGQLFLFFLNFYSLGRFLLDFSRSQEPGLSDPRLSFFSISQWISLLLFLITAILLKKEVIKK